MFQKGPPPGATPKEDALKLLPGAKCKAAEYGSIRGFVVELEDGQRIVSAGNAADAWRKAIVWAERRKR